MQPAHDGMVEVESSGDEREISLEVAKLDARHDSLVGEIGQRLDAEIDSALTNEVDKAAFVSARGQIFGSGESLLKASYAAKAGAHEVRERRVTPASIALLATVPVRGGGTLADRYAALQATTASLSDADSRRRAALSAKSGPRVREARKRWVASVETAHMLLTAAGVDTTPILGPIREAQARSKPVETDEPAMPTDPGVPATT